VAAHDLLCRWRRQRCVQERSEDRQRRGKEMNCIFRPCKCGPTLRVSSSSRW
jgi:hypothetical protein